VSELEQASFILCPVHCLPRKATVQAAYKMTSDKTSKKDGPDGTEEMASGNLHHGIPSFFPFPFPPPLLPLSRSISLALELPSRVFWHLAA
jgi:hypothetical protein